MSLALASRAAATGRGLDSPYSGTPLLMYVAATSAALLVFVAALHRAETWHWRCTSYRGFGTRNIPLGASATLPDSPFVEPPVVGTEVLHYPAAHIAIFALARRWTGRAPI